MRRRQWAVAEVYLWPTSIGGGGGFSEQRIYREPSDGTPYLLIVA